MSYIKDKRKSLTMEEEEANSSDTDELLTSSSLQYSDSFYLTNSPRLHNYHNSRNEPKDHLHSSLPLFHQQSNPFHIGLEQQQELLKNKSASLPTTPNKNPLHRLKGQLWCTNKYNQTLKANPSAKNQPDKNFQKQFVILNPNNADFVNSNPDKFMENKEHDPKNQFGTAATSRNYDNSSPLLPNTSATSPSVSDRSVITILKIPEEIKNPVTTDPSKMEHSRSVSDDIMKIEQVRRYLKRVMSSPSKLSDNIPFELISNNYSKDAIKKLNIQDTSILRLSKPESSAFENSLLTNLPFGGKTNCSDAVLIEENKLLKNSLEKENFKRKHCEKEAQDLHMKLLETQQHLIVSEATEKKKDVILQQLDKILLNVVDGWKFHELEKLENLEKLRIEKENIEKMSIKREQMIKSLEKELSEVVEELANEQSKSTIADKEKQVQIDIQKREKSKLLVVMSKEKEQVQKLKQLLDNAVIEKEKLHGKIQSLQETLRKEQRGWQKKEEILTTKINKFQEELNLKTRVAEKHINAISELEETKNHFNKLDQELKVVKEEKVHLQSEFVRLEQQYEKNQIKFENDLKTSIETMMREKISIAEKEMQHYYESKAQALYMHYQEELHQQRIRMVDQMKIQENKILEDLKTSEKNLQEVKTQLELLTCEKQKLENFRTEITLWLKTSLINQWNESLKILGLTNDDEVANASSVPCLSHSFHENVPKSFPLQNEIPVTVTVSSETQDVVRHPRLLYESSNYNIQNVLTNIGTDTFDNSKASHCSKFLPTTDFSLYRLDNSNSSCYSNQVRNLQAIRISEKSSLNSGSFVDKSYNNKSLSSEVYPQSNTDTNTENNFTISIPEKALESNWNNADLKVDKPEKDNLVASQDSFGLQNQKGSQLEHYIKMLLERTIGDPLEEQSSGVTEFQKNSDGLEITKEDYLQNPSMENVLDNHGIIFSEKQLESEKVVSEPRFHVEEELSHLLDVYSHLSQVTASESKSGDLQLNQSDKEKSSTHLFVSENASKPIQVHKEKSSKGISKLTNCSFNMNTENAIKPRNYQKESSSKLTSWR